MKEKLKCYPKDTKMMFVVRIVNLWLLSTSERGDTVYNLFCRKASSESMGLKLKTVVAWKAAKSQIFEECRQNCRM